MFASNQLCYCHSGRKFGACCGDPSPDRKPPFGLHIYRDLFSKTECKKLVRLAELQKRQWLTLKDNEKSIELGATVRKRDPARVAQGVDISSYFDKINNCVNQAILKCVEPVTKQLIDFYEVPQLMRYGVGGLYKSHADSENFDAASGQWVKSFDRDVSLLVYLNDKYEGGGLRFNDLNYTHQPEAGDVVFFPSHHLYLHESLPITSGVKYAIVTWATVQGKNHSGENVEARITPDRSAS